MKLFIRFTLIALLALIGGQTFAYAFDIPAIYPAVIIAGSNFIPDIGNVLALRIFTAPGGIATPFAFNMTYLPEFISWNDAGNPLTSLRIETQEDGVLHDFTAAGLAAMNGFMFPGALAANQVGFRVADGHLAGKNVTISGVTSAVGAINMYVVSDNVGTAAFKSSNANILPLNPTTFKNFTALFIPALATTTDRAEITYKDGHVQNWALEDILFSSSLFQEAQRVCINNISSYIDKVEVTCAAATPAYIMSVHVPK